METQEFTNHRPLDLTSEEQKMLRAVMEYENISEREAETLLDNWKHRHYEMEFWQGDTLKDFVSKYLDIEWDIKGYTIPSHIARKLIKSYISPEIIAEELNCSGFKETSTGTLYMDEY